MALLSKDNLVGTLTESLEDYLEIIYRLVQDHKVARVRDIAQEKGVKTSSVTSALHRLAKEGLVDYQAREYVDLTEEGREFAFRVHQRHSFLKRLLMELLQVDEATAEKDACSMEHAISVTTLDRMAALAEFLTYCPRVTAGLVDQFRNCWLLKGEDTEHECHDGRECGIWQKRMKLQEDLGVYQLTDVEEGSRGYIARIIGSEADRIPLIQRGFFPAASFSVARRYADGRITLKVSREEKTLTPDEAAMIYVWIAPKDEESNGSTPPSSFLADITPGNRFEVVQVKARGEIRQRLIDMGFVRGAQGKVLREALLKDPIEIELSGYLLSLRRSEAAEIQVEGLNGGS
jgi:DtxR family Mn-dependent transcriptional regulator